MVNSSLAQKVSDFEALGLKYKSYEVISLNTKTEYFVSIKDGRLEIEETSFQERYYNSFRAGAYSEATVESSHATKLKDIEACTLIPDNNEFKKIKVKDFKTKEVLDETVFYQDVFSTSFTYPSLRQGAITQLQYVLTINKQNFSPIIFAKNIWPILNFELVISSDKDIEWGFCYLNIDTTTIQMSKQIKGNRVVYSWKLHDIDGFKKEDNAPSNYCVLPQILPYIKSYTFKNKETHIYRNTDDLFKWYSGYLDSLDHRHTSDMISTVAQLTENCSSEKQKVANIYSWVQKNIKYIANEYGLGGNVPRNGYQIFEKRYGDCKDMANIIIELLEIAGIKANYTWIGTRELPYSPKIFPSSFCADHMIATYYGNDGVYFLDATNPHNQLGLTSSFIQGKEAFIKKSDTEYEILTVPIVTADTNVVTDSINITIDNEQVTGKGVLNAGGYYCSNLKQALNKIEDSQDKTKFCLSYLRKGNNKFALNDYNISSSNTNLLFDYSFSVPDYVKQNNDELYVNVNFSQTYRDFELFKDDRKFPYEIHFTFIVKEKCVLNIPDKYEVKYIPEASQFTADGFSCWVKYKKTGNQILYELQIRCDKIQINPTQFADWNKMIKQLRQIYKETIVLKRTK